MTDNKNIHEAIHAVMQEVGYVKKERAANLNYSFAGEAALIAALRPSMVEHGIYMHVLEIKDVQREQYTTARGTAMVNTVISAIVRFIHAPSGTSIDVAATGEGSDAGDKSANKAMTGLFKYAIRQTYMIETGDDPDKQASEEGGQRSKSAKVTAPPVPDGDSRIWSVAQRDALIKAGLAKNEFSAKGMLDLSMLTITATQSEIVEWGKVYRVNRVGI